VWRARRFAGKKLFPKNFLKSPGFLTEGQGKMQSTMPAAPRDPFPPQTKLNLPAVTARAKTTTATNGKLPLEILAASPFADTDFRRKIGIERWGWGLND
jgi:hypothetical protein